MGTLTKSATDQRTEISEVQLAVINRVNHFGNYVFIFCYVTNPSANQISKTQPCLCMNNQESSIAQYNHEWSLINIEYGIRIAAQLAHIFLLLRSHSFAQSFKGPLLTPFIFQRNNASKIKEDYLLLKRSQLCGAFDLHRYDQITNSLHKKFFEKKR